MISPFREDFIFGIFAYAKFRESKTLVKISEFYSINFESTEHDQTELSHYSHTIARK